MHLREYIDKLDAAKPGAQVRFAESLSVDRGTFNKWVQKHRDVPLERCVDIERASGGAVTCEELRPDMRTYFGYLRHTKLERGRAVRR